MVVVVKVVGGGEGGCGLTAGLGAGVATGAVVVLTALEVMVGTGVGARVVCDRVGRKVA